MRIFGTLGIDASGDVAYVYTHKMNLVRGAGQVAILLATVLVPVFKPWKNIRKRVSDAESP